MLVYYLTSQIHLSMLWQVWLFGICVLHVVVMWLKRHIYLFFSHIYRRSPQGVHAFTS